MVRRNWASSPLTPSKKQLKQMKLDFLVMNLMSLFLFCAEKIEGSSKFKSTYKDPLGPNCLAARAIMDNKKGSPNIQRRRRQSRAPNFSCLLKIISVKALTATMLTIRTCAVINSSSVTP